MPVQHLNVGILDDHPIMLRAITQLLVPTRQFHVVGAFQHSTALLDALRVTPMDILILDARLDASDLTCPGLLDLLRERAPELRILLLATVDDIALIDQTLTHGAHACVAKEEADRHLIDGLRKIRHTPPYLSPRLRMLTGVAGANKLTADS